jgi:hypothetical protein
VLQLLLTPVIFEGLLLLALICNATAELSDTVCTGASFISVTLKELGHDNGHGSAETALGISVLGCSAEAPRVHRLSVQ